MRLLSGKLSRRFRLLAEEKYAYLSILPVFTIVFGFTIYPILSALFFSVQKYRIGLPSFPFVGLQNYFDVLVSKSFQEAFVNTAYFVLTTVPLSILISLGIALVLNQGFRGNTLLRVALLIPWAMPGISAAALWSWIYDAEYGAWNGVLHSLGFIETYQPWKSSFQWAMPILINVHLWKFIPISSILFLAALATIPPSLYEAAEVDGAGVWKKFRVITIPMLKPMLRVILFLQTVYALLWHFVWVYVITRGGPGGATTTLPWFTYIKAFAALDFGQGSALGIILALLVATLLPIYLRQVRLRATS
ncbi:MAG: carbohydrate ABC transporter permease [Candidatus Geothermarchaeales archaeon]